MTNAEEWRPFLDGAYEVSNVGNVRRAKPGRRTWAGRPVARTIMTIGYECVGPTVNGKNVTMYVHDLVAAAFIGPKPHGFTVNHIDGVKTNNVIGNLEYVTHAENMAHAGRIGLMAKGERHPATKLSDVDVSAIRFLRASGSSGAFLARVFDVSQASISMICSGKKRCS